MTLEPSNEFLFIDERPTTPRLLLVCSACRLIDTYPIPTKQQGTEKEGGKQRVDHPREAPASSFLYSF
jgi:hypothetical protein